ncbi:MAG: hypothetical protein P8Z70_03190, partial [Desulfuromonadales bacterium]
LCAKGVMVEFDGLFAQAVEKEVGLDDHDRFLWVRGFGTEGECLTSAADWNLRPQLYRELGRLPSSTAW